MAKLEGNLWEYNLARIIVVDVTDDYRLMQPPMPSDFYPVLEEIWLPAVDLASSLHKIHLVQGYLYDWHERPSKELGEWYVGVVKENLAKPEDYSPRISASL